MFESSEEHGLSHIIEHMVFKEQGTSLIRELELCGAEINAFTYKENVCFELECLAKYLPEFLPKFFDLFLNLEFTDEQLEKEKKVILQELKEDKDDHETYGLEHVFEKNFKRNLGHPTGGKPKDVKSYNSNDIRKYYRKYYRPNRIVLTVISGHEFEGLESIFKSAMDQHYTYKASSAFRLKAIHKISKINHFKSKIKRSMESSVLFYSFTAPSLSHKHYYDLAILDQLLFDGLSSIFFKELREETPLIYGLGSSINSFKDVGNYVMVFNSDKKNLTELKSRVKIVLKRCSDLELDSSDVEAIKKRILDAWDLSFDSVEERATFLSDNEIYQFDEISMEKVRKNIAKSTPKSIKSLVNLLLSHGNSELIIESK
jgi:predicted Zn-dependent peptidase